MSDENGFERLITEGFFFEALSIRGATLRASYGDGYAESAVIGSPDGLLTWKVKINVLPDDDDYLVNAGAYGLQTRERYLWDFYVRHNVANAFKPLWLRDPKSGRDYLVEIVEEQLDYQLLCLTASSTGLTLRQRRVFGVSSPGDPVTAENNQEI
jgi:hypothetical protein